MFVLRPVLAGCITYDMLLDGSPLDLADIAIINAALDVQAENERRVNEAVREKS